MIVITAKTAGFCFGVERAINLVNDCLNKGEHIATLGPIIHNPQMTEELSEKGVRVIENIPENTDGRKIIIRSHGVSSDIYKELEKYGYTYLDATCPFVEKIHRIVSENSGENRVLIIAGDSEHPEVIGIYGHSQGETIVVKDATELENTVKTLRENDEIQYVMVAQTTFNVKEWEKCVKILKKVCTKPIIFDTICSATSLRQKEAEELAKNSDMMIVIGGRHSSNTKKLYDICSTHCETMLIETAKELGQYNFSKAAKIGVTAGASTPACIIKEVQRTMSEIQNNEMELSFEEMLEQSFKNTYTGEKVTAIVTGIKPNEISVDIGTKHAGYVPLHELTDDPSAKPENLVKVGDSIELIVLRVNDVEGMMVLSKKRLDAIAGFEKVMGAVDTGEILEGIITEVVKGGVLALTNGVKVFIPASQATVSRTENLETLLKKPVSFKILEVNKQRRRAVGSIKAVLKDQRKILEDKFWETAVEGTTFSGVVKSMTDFGAFIDLGGVDGMVHISELSWDKIKHPSQVVKVGDVLEVYIKSLDHEKKKISLGYKKTQDNPWEILKKDYEVGAVVKAKIVSVTAFGAFAQIFPGVDGLIHISQIAKERIAKPADVLSVGQEVDVKITEIDFDKKRISLSIRALLGEDEPEATEALAEETAE